MDAFVIKKKGIKAPLQVYRALDKLVEIGKIHKVESRNAFIACKSSSCEISQATAFSICNKCENVSEINNPKLSKYLIFLPGQALLDNAMPNRRIRNPKVEWHTKTCNIKMNVK